MTQKEYLEYGKQYVEIKSTIEQWKFGIAVEKKFPKSKFKIFSKWMNYVNYSQSHIKRNQTNKELLDRLEKMLSSKE